MFHCGRTFVLSTTRTLCDFAHHIPRDKILREGKGVDSAPRLRCTHPWITFGQCEVYTFTPDLHFRPEKVVYDRWAELKRTWTLDCSQVGALPWEIK